MKNIDITAFREMVTDYLTSELESSETIVFNNLIESNETFAEEFRLMSKAWEGSLVAKVGINIPKMSNRLINELEGELLDEDLDMVSGGVKSDPEVDPDDIL